MNPLRLNFKFPRFPIVTISMVVILLISFFLKKSIPTHMPDWYYLTLALFSPESIQELFASALIILCINPYIEQRLKIYEYAIIYISCSLGTYLILHLLGAHQFEIPPNSTAAILGLISSSLGLFYKTKPAFYLSVKTKKHHVGFSIGVISIILVMGLIALNFLNTDKMGHALIQSASGPIIGVLLGSGIRLLRPLNDPFIYDDELKEFESIQNTQNLLEKIELASKVLRYNPENYLVSNHLVKQITKDAFKTSKLHKQSFNFLKVYCNDYFQSHLSRGQFHEVLDLITSIPTSFPFYFLFPSLSPSYVSTVLDHAIEENNLILALRLYDLLIFQSPEKMHDTDLLKKMKQFAKTIYQDESNIQTLNNIFLSHKKSDLFKYLAEEIFYENQRKPA